MIAPEIPARRDLSPESPATAPGTPVSAAALQRLFAFWGMKVGLRQLDEALKAAGNPGFGADQKTLFALGRVIGQAGAGHVRLATTRVALLKQKHLPALVELDGKAWVICAMDGDTLRLDAGGESREVPRQALATASAIWVERAAAPGGEEKSSGQARRMIVRALLQRRRVLAEIAIATLLTSILTIATSFFAMQVYDRVIPTYAYSTLWALVGIVGILIGFDFVLRLIRARLLDRISREIDEEISATVFNAVMGVRLDARPPSVGTLAAQVAALEGPRAFFASSMLFGIGELPFIILFLVLIVFIAGPLALVYFGITLAAFGSALLAHLRLKAISRRQIRLGYQRNGLLVESIAGAETIKSTAADWRYADRWREVTAEIARMSLRSRAVMAGATTLTQSLSSIGYVAAVVYGVTLIESGSLTIGGLIACTILGGRVIAPIASGVGLIVQMQSVGQSLRAADALLELPAEGGGDPGLLSPRDIGNDLAAENLRYFYSDVPIPQVDIESLRIAEGERVVLVGPPGSGKSTLLKMLAGLYRPSDGRIVLGGVDMSLIDPVRVREIVGYLPQDAMLFQGTVRENLVIGGAVPDDDLIRVVRLLGLDEMLGDHPKGLDRRITEAGSGLSGGQRQMAGLARLMLRRPRVWLLDEPASGLDAAHEARIYGTLGQVVQPRDTVIIVSHRPQSIQFADRVIVMRKGRVVHSGPRQEFVGRMRSLARRRQGQEPETEPETAP